MSTTKAKSVREIEYGFPYTNATNFYFEVLSGGEVRPVDRKVSSTQDTFNEVYKRIKNNESILYVTWTNNYNTELFMVDDITGFAKAFGFMQETEYKFSWSVSEEHCGSQSNWMDIEIIGELDLDIGNFYSYLYSRFGWEIDKYRGVKYEKINGRKIVTLAIKSDTIVGSRGEHNLNMVN